MTNRKMAVVIAAALAGWALPASAVTLVDTGDQAQSFGGTVLSGGQVLAGGFTVGSAYEITSISAFIGSFDQLPLQMFLYANDHGAPGALLHSARFSSVGNGLMGSWQGLSDLDWAVTAGTYFIGFEDDTGLSAVPANAANPLPAYFVSRSSGGWSSVPGVNFGVRINADAPAAPAVPEPASWSLMIAGFGLLGGALRRRGRLAAA